MRPTIFTTDNGNDYLYIPSARAFYPIPRRLKAEAGDPDACLRRMQEMMKPVPGEEGRLSEFTADYRCDATADDIEAALANLPQVVFEVTTDCNLRCRYCCYGHGYETFRNRQSGRLRFEDAKAVLDFLAEKSRSRLNASASTPFVISFYGGEPLLNIGLIKEIVAYSERLEMPGRHLRYSMTTNATHLAEHIDFLQAHDFSLLVSLDGDREMNAYRVTASGENAYDSVAQNLEAVRLRYPDYFATIRFNSVYTDRTDTDALLAFFKDTMGCAPTINALHAPDASAPEYEAVSRMLKPIATPTTGIAEVGDMLQIPLYRRILEITRRLSQGYLPSDMALIDDGKEPAAPTATCLPFAKRMFVSASGQLLPCEKICRDNPCGSVAGGTVSLDTQRIADNFNAMLEEAAKQCRECYLQQCCMQCAHNFKKGVCPGFTDQQGFERLMAEAFSYMELHPGIIAQLEENTVSL